jgi:hypothetical protein
MVNYKATRGLEHISYRGVLVNILLHAIVCVFLHNLLYVLIQIANKMGFKKKLSLPSSGCICDSIFPCHTQAGVANPLRLLWAA